MAGENSVSDEDYLDNLLKSITDNTSEKTDDVDFDSDFEKALAQELNQVESEDDFLNRIENDLFSSNEVSGVSGDFNSNYLNLNEENKTSKDSKYDIDNEIPEKSDIEEDNNKSKNKKKTKKGFFGRKKNQNIIENNDKELENPDEDVENPVIKETDFDTLEYSNEQGEIDNNTEDLDDDLLSSLENFVNGNEETFENTESEINDFYSSNETPEDQISELMDILGTSQDEADNKSKKKSFFSKRNKKKENNEAVSDTVSNNADKGITEGTEYEDFDSSLALFDETIENNEDGKISETEPFDIGLDLGFDEGLGDEKQLNENEQLIRQMDRGEIDEEELLEEKEKPKKKKKEKKQKVKKVKAPKKKKVKKPKKIKEKEPDEIIPIPKTLVILSFSLIILLTVVLIFGGKMNYYNNKMKTATSYYVNKNYSAAYSEIAGMDVKDEDIDFYNQVFTIMMVMRQYESGNSLVKLGDYESALDSYLKGITFYDKYQNKARELDCFDEMTEILGFIASELSDVYGLSESDARQLVLIEDREEYAFKVKVLAKEVSEKITEEKDDSNN